MEDIFLEASLKDAHYACCFCYQLKQCILLSVLHCVLFVFYCQVGQLWDISNKAHNAPKIFMDAKHGAVMVHWLHICLLIQHLTVSRCKMLNHVNLLFQDLWPLPPEKIRGDILLFVKLYDCQREELWYVFYTQLASSSFLVT